MSGSAWNGRWGGAGRSRGGTEGLFKRNKHVSSTCCPSPSLSLDKWLDYTTKTSAKGLSLLGPLPYAWLKLQGPTIKHQGLAIKIHYLVTLTSLSNQDWPTHPSTHFPSFPLETIFPDCIHLIQGQSTLSTCPGNKISLVLSIWCLGVLCANWDPRTETVTTIYYMRTESIFNW